MNGLIETVESATVRRRNGSQDRLKASRPALLKHFFRGDLRMMRNVAVSGFVCALVLAAASNSYAAAAGNSYKIDVSDGTKAAVAFDGMTNAMLVHVPGADVAGTYREVGGNISIVIGTSVSKTYLGAFVALQVGFGKVIPSTLTGFGLGTTGVYTFTGAVK